MPLKVDRRVLQTVPLALQRRVMRQVLQKALKRPSFEQIEELITLITAPNRSRTDPFPGGAIAEVDGDWIWLKPSEEYILLTFVTSPAPPTLFGERILHTFAVEVVRAIA